MHTSMDILHVHRVHSNMSSRYVCNDTQIEFNETRIVLDGFSKVLKGFFFSNTHAGLFFFQIENDGTYSALNISNYNK